ncbi:LysR substrate-binding domain-containing protein, partial [Mixta calida]
IASGATAIAMLEAKPGIGGIQTLLAAEQLRQGTLVQLLPDYRWEPPTLYAIYPTRRFIPLKARLLTDALTSSLHSVSGIIPL